MTRCHADRGKNPLLRLSHHAGVNLRFTENSRGFAFSRAALPSGFTSVVASRRKFHKVNCL